MQAVTPCVGTVVNPNGYKINGVAGNMPIDVDNFAFWLVFVNAAYGWKVTQ
jgi:hypothetical protein